jgi:DNA replication protein DnaC
LFTSFGAIIKSVSNFEVDKNRFFKDFGRFDLIVLDDLGTERSSAFALEQVFDVVDNRVQSMLPMIVTTNLTLTELKNPESRSYQRIYDRLLQVCTPVNFNGESRRKEQAEWNIKAMQIRMST